MSAAERPSRRVLLGGAALAVLALAGCQTVAPLPAGTRIGTVRVDVSHLVAIGVGPRAETIRETLQAELMQLLGVASAPRGQAATLVVAVRGVTTPTYVGSVGDDDAGSDAMESVVTVLGPDGRPLATFPVMSLTSPGDAGPWFAPDLIDRRIALMTLNHARWIARRVGPGAA